MIRVYRNLIDISNRDLETSRSHVLRAGKDIFNPDKKRIQAQLADTGDDDDGESLRARFKAALQRCGALRGRVFGPMFVLHSFKGCKQQQWHTDYDPESLTQARTKPCGALLALQDGTRLAVRDAASGKEQDVVINRGDSIVFTGDTVHAGAAYSKENTRAHAYLDTVSVKRLPNTTWLCP